MNHIKQFIIFMFSRLLLVALMLIAQVGLIWFALYYFSSLAYYIHLTLIALSMLMVVLIVSNNSNPTVKITWIIAILLMPLTGGVFYLIFGNKRLPKKLRRHMKATLEDSLSHMPKNDLCTDILAQSSPDLMRKAEYIYNMSGYPVWDKTFSEYFSSGEDMFAQMLTDIKKAKKFIFLEFFIIQDGIMWGSILEILRAKIAQGVEVRLIYDDIGCIKTLPDGYDRMLRKSGIKLCVFNPLRPHVNSILNYRDHRKIIVIDGNVAFTGGINLADEYINKTTRFGHWKDSGIMLRGRAVWSFTFMFLQQWQFGTGERVDFQKFHWSADPEPSNGLVQVFGDTPLDHVNLTEMTYQSIISRATNYVYITSPYLVIDYSMEETLCAAASSGVDVRIITPYKYDRWYVHNLTRSHYLKLTLAGVKIYEYTPGFMHGKMFVSDDKVCLVGTCNMDYRSFYLHYECTVAFYNSSIVQKVKQDILHCLSISHQILPQQAAKTPLPVKALRAMLKLFAPLA